MQAGGQRLPGREFKNPVPMKCPKCNDDSMVICHGKRYAMYPSGCLALIGPILAVIHQASTPVDYECKSCGLEFSRRSTAAKIGLIGILLFILYLIWVTYVDLSRIPEP
jgi:transcription elongation factor Elf1